jgi:hypothetical protein
MVDPPPALDELLVVLPEEPLAAELLVAPLEALDAPPLAPVPPVVPLDPLPQAQRPALSTTADTPKNARVDFMCAR